MLLRLSYVPGSRHRSLSVWHVLRSPQDILNIRIRRFRYGRGRKQYFFWNSSSKFTVWARLLCKTQTLLNVVCNCISFLSYMEQLSSIRSSWGASFWSLCLKSPVTPCSLPTPPAPIFSPLFERQDKECKVTHFIGSVQCLLRYNELQLLLLLFSQLFVLFKLL